MVALGPERVVNRLHRAATRCRAGL